MSNESNLNVNVYFDDLKITHSSNLSIVSADDYYPFGLTFNEYQNQEEEGNNFLFNGVELQKELDLGLYQTWFRMYDPALGRFQSIDPLADIIPSISSYHFGYNNPINISDPLGLIGEDQNDYFVIKRKGGKKKKGQCDNRRKFNRKKRRRNRKKSNNSSSGSTVIFGQSLWERTFNMNEADVYAPFLMDELVIYSGNSKGFARSMRNPVAKSVRNATGDFAPYAAGMVAGPLALFGGIELYASYGIGLKIASLYSLASADINAVSIYTYVRGSALIGRGVGYIGAGYFYAGYRLFGDKFIRLSPRLFTRADIGHSAAVFLRSDFLRQFPNVRNWNTIYWQTSQGNGYFHIGVNPWTRSIFHESYGHKPF